jgi:hypothetical protein
MRSTIPLLLEPKFGHFGRICNPQSGLPSIRGAVTGRLLFHVFVPRSRVKAWPPHAVVDFGRQRPSQTAAATRFSRGLFGSLPMPSVVTVELLNGMILESRHTTGASSAEAPQPEGRAQRARLTTSDSPLRVSQAASLYPR